MVPDLDVAVAACAVASLAAAGLALAVRRRDPARVRVAAVLVVAVALLAAADWPWRELRVEPGELHVATTRDANAPQAAWAARLAQDAQREGGRVAVHKGRADEALLAAALGARDGASIAVCWDGAFDPASIAAPAALAASAHATAEPWPFEADDLVVTALAPGRAARPAALELRFAARMRDAWSGVPPSGAAVRCVVRDDAGKELVAVEQAMPRDATPLVVPFVPAHEGTHGIEVVVTAASGGQRVRARGAFQVAAEQREVVVIGSRGVAAVRALEAQGRRVRRVAELPDDLAPDAVLVATSPLRDADAQRVLQHVDGGGGLMLVAGRDGGAVPLGQDALAALAPLLRLAALPIRNDPGDAGGAGGEVGPPTPTPGPDPTPPRAAAANDETVVASQRDVTIEHRQVALVLVVDKSGSMSEALGVLGRSKLDLAKLSALETAVALEPGDELGVVAFGERDYAILPLSAAPPREEVERAIGGLAANDSDTLIGGAMQRAEQWLAASTAPVKHVVVVTDGELQDPGDAALGQATARRLAQSGATVSVLLIAPGGFARSERLARIADLGRGRFVREDDGTSIPRFVAAEVTRTIAVAGRGARTKDPVEPEREPQPETEPQPEPTEPHDVPVPEPPLPEPPPGLAPPSLRVVAVEDSPLLAPLPSGEWPALTGIARVEANDRALVLLATADGTPLLAFRHHGLGRVAAWAADFAGPDARAWLEDPSFPARLSTWVDALAPPFTVAAPGEICDERSREPAGPSVAELAWLTRAAGGATVTPIAELRMPSPRRVASLTGLAPETAIVLAAGLLLLAAFEAAVRRREAS
ncbi:MAG: VWA domain-containing protein [Planctomycetes bacterium]|nr:VWA domain-containing protein [Planctomycetota bacterium]